MEYKGQKLKKLVKMKIAPTAKRTIPSVPDRIPVK